jgi:DNA-3-methyladenine glycosylase II
MMPEGHDLTPSAPRGSFTLEPRGPFSLAASIRFLEGFEPAGFASGGSASAGTAPGAGTGSGVQADAPARLDCAFPLEGSWQTVGVSVEQTGGTVRGRLFAGRPLRREELSAARQQVERILSLDVDGSGYASVGDHDPVIGGLQRRYEGMRPVCFWSWYEAAAWAIIVQRQRLPQAAAVKRRMSVELGETVVVNGAAQQAFPRPAVLAGIESFPGLTSAKVERLRALAEVARRNAIDGAGLRRLTTDEALAALLELPGIGPFSAELVLVRGAGAPDVVPTVEKRLAAAVSAAYELRREPTADDVAALAAQWAPYRSWVTVLLRTAAAEQTRDPAR